MTRPVEPGSRPTPRQLPLPPILPAPKPVRRAAPVRVSQAPANTHTGANPRGVAIITPPSARKPTINDRAARTLGTGDNPRGVAIEQPTPKGRTSKQVVHEIFNHQDLPHQAAIIRGAMKPGTDPYLRKTIFSAWRGLGIDQQTAMQKYLPHGAGESLGKAVSDTIGLGEHALMSLNTSSHGSRGSRLTESGLSAGSLGETLVRAPLDVTRAAVESPGTVIPKTVTGLGAAAVGGLAGLAELPIHAVQDTLKGHPTQAFTELAQAAAHDYKTRYGSLYGPGGSDRAFIDRIKKQGAAPELLDALGVAGAADLTAGRAITDAAASRARLAGKEADTGFLSRPRPGLKISGGDVRAQKLAHGAGRITAQRVEDRLRAAKEARSPGQIKTESGEVRPLFGNRSQRVLASHVAAKYRRYMQEHLNREVRKGAAPGLARMSRWERRAAPVVGEGFIPLRRGEQAAVDAIDARIAGIVKYRADHPEHSSNHIPEEYRERIDELHNLQALKENVHKWLTPRLADFVDTEGERGGRVEKSMPNSALKQPVAEARRLRAQGEALGIEHPDTIDKRLSAERERATEVAALGKAKEHLPFGADLKRARRIVEAKAHDPKYEDFEQARPGLLADYSGRVRTAARAKGLPEPFFMHHSDVPHEKLGDYTSGSGHAAMPAPKRSEFSLWHGGSVDRNPAVYTSGLARSIKYGHQWPLVDEQLRRSAFNEPSAKAIEDAGFGKRSSQSLTGREYTKAMMFDGHKAENLHLYNPQRLRESTMDERGLTNTRGSSRAGSVPPDLEASPMIHDMLNRGTLPVKGADAEGRIPGMKDDDPFVKDTGWKALPPAAYKEIHSSLLPSGFGGRALGKLQGTMAHLILAGSPSFLVMNTLAHVVLASFGTRGRLLTDAAKFPLWWHGLSDEQRNEVRAHSGGRGQSGVERLGSTTPTRLAHSWDQLKQAGIGRFTVGAVASHGNPFAMLFRAEDIQSNFFRHMVYYHATKRAALDAMTKDMSLGASAMERMGHVFTLGPKKEMIAQIENLHTAEELGRHTVNMMGDYARFTNFERKFINNRAVLFYSFLRHATRTLFYVLPVHHPIATAMVGELAKLHNDEVKKLLGGADLPYANSRVFFGANGHLSSIDMARSSPIGSIGAEIPSEGIAGAAGLIPPEVQPFLDALYKQTPLGGTYQQNLYSLVNSFISQSYPERLLAELHDGTQMQQSDSIPFIHDRPKVAKSETAAAYQAAKEAASGPINQKMLAGLVGLYPKPDNTGVVAAHQNQAAASKAARASDSWIGSSSAGSSGGGSSSNWWDSGSGNSGDWWN